MVGLLDETVGGLLELLPFVNYSRVYRGETIFANITMYDFV